jgi:hypothetical protein
MADSDSRTQITVAMIGVVGVLLAALIGNWDKIFGPKDPPRAATPAQIQHPKPPPGVVQGPGTLGNDPDGVVILKASPPSGSTLKQGDLVQFTVLVRYRLTSLEKATLSVGLVEYPHATTCGASGNIPASGNVPIFRGENTVEVPIEWKVGVSKSVVTDGSIGYTASFWSDFQSRQLFRSFTAMPGYCYQFS